MLAFPTSFKRGYAWQEACAILSADERRKCSMSDDSARYHPSIQQGYGTIVGNYNTITQHFHFYAGVPTLSTDYAHRIQNFLTEYLGTPGQPVPFGGRDADLARLDAWLEDPKAPPYALLAAPAGRGKSALLVQWTQRLLRRQDLAVVFFPISIRFRTNLATVAFASLVARLAALHGEPVPTSPKTSVEVWRDLVHQYLSRPLPDGKRLVLVLDALDEAAWEVGPDLFPSVPPPRVHILVSARLLVGDADATAWLCRLGWERLEYAQTHEVQTLSQDGLVEVLKSMGAPLDQLGDQRAIIQELYRLTEGDPLLIRLYVEALWKQGENAPRLQPKDLSLLRPGLRGYFERWWEEQQKLWGKRTLLGKRVEEVLNLLACALGPLSKEDLLYLASPQLKLTSWTLEEALRPLHRLVLGDGRTMGYAFSHPRLAGYFFSERLTKGERQAVEQRYLQWGAQTVATLNASAKGPAQAPSYLLQYYGAHLERSRDGVPALLALVSQGWMRAWERFEGTYAGFLQDTARAWRAAEREDESAIVAGQRSPLLGAEVLCTLCQTSVNSLATNIPSALLVSLIRKRYWTEAQGVAYARQVADPQQRVWLLSELVPLLPEPLKTEGVQAALIAMQAIKDEESRVYVFSKIAPQLPEEVLVQALEVLQSIKDEVHRAAALSALALRLSGEQRLPVLEAALESLPAIMDEWGRAKVLSMFAPQLPERLLVRALEMAQAIQNEGARSEVLSALAPWLPERLLTQALKAVEAIETEWCRVKVLRVLAPQLSEGMLVQVLESLQAIKDKGHFADVLSALVPRVPEWELAQVLKAVESIETEWFRAKVLLALIPRLPEGELTQALKQAQAIQNEGARAEVFSALAPRLDRGLLAQALEAMQAIKDVVPRAKALSALAPRLPEEQRLPVLEVTLEAARVADDERRVKVLSALVPQLSGGLLEAVLEIAQAIKDEERRVQVLNTLAPKLLEEQRLPVLTQALKTAQSIKDEECRARVLSALAPQLSEGLLEVALEAAQAIQNEECCVQVLSALAPRLPERLLAQALEAALDAAQAIEDDRACAYVLTEFSPWLSQRLLKRALEALPAIKDEGYRAEVLSVLAPWLPEGHLPPLLKAAQVIEDEWGRAKALS